MATLIACPACNASVSNAAPTCPKCGHPFVQSGFTHGLNPRHTGQVVTIEKTGKGLKLAGVLGALVLIVSVVMVIVGLQEGSKDFPAIWIVLGVLSLIWLLIVRVLTWWKHG